MTTDPPNGTILCIIPAPSHEYRREPASDRWCFGCRAHLPHDAVLLGEPPEEMSYYEPHWTWLCSRCGRDRTDFGS